MTRNAHKIPATVITGFLGAGKTSLIRHVLETADGRRLALIINEFGELGVDRELLAGCGVEGCSEDDIVELANGCICCTVADEFVPTIEALLARPDPPEHIVIETSGLALPKPLIKAFNWPAIRTRVTVDGVVAVIDAAAVADGRFAADPQAVAAQRAADPALDHDSPLEEVFEDQIMCADLVILNKSDLVDAETLARVRGEVKARLGRAVKVVSTRYAAVDAQVLLGLGAAAEDDLESRPSHHDGIDGAHDHDDFESFVVSLGPVADPEALHRRIALAVAAHDILRIKGFLDVPGKEMRHVVQAVGARIQRYYDRPWRDGEARLSRLVVIGEKGLDRAAVAAALGA
ncbi:MAG: cobalamin biosynthesis protein CobW [Proteobacteria bacterium]|nr:cobalamin biosynthesis protein CobW [Pseudomonadota bacterium]